MVLHRSGALVLAPIFIALFVFLTGGIVMLLWNWLLPPLFDWRQITLLQGFGLLGSAASCLAGLAVAVAAAIGSRKT